MHPAGVGIFKSRQIWISGSQHLLDVSFEDPYTSWMSIFEDPYTCRMLVLRIPTPARCQFLEDPYTMWKSYGAFIGQTRTKFLQLSPTFILFSQKSSIVTSIIMSQ